MKKIIFIFLILTKSVSSFAWGPTGHKIVVEIAKKYLKGNVQDSVQKYLGDMSFEDASIWMDDMRKDHSYDYMKPWHYVDIEKDKTYVKTKDENIINELDLVIDELKSKKNRGDINKDLKILFHLTGDLHQPLHSGYGSDKEGNAIDVDFLGKKTSLHWTWDTEIIESKGITLESCLKHASGYSEKQIKELQKIDVEKWMNESRAFLPNVYDYKDGIITQEYVDKNAPIIEKQLLIAGLRLAEILNETFN
ncbi:MAG: S1/P1 nuclease [Bacteroidia bacterium]